MARTERPTHLWGVPMTIGVLLIIGGTFALLATVLTSIVSVLYLGVLLIAVGVLEVFAAIRARKAGPGPVLTYLGAGLLALVVGALFLDRPLVSLASVTLLIAGYLFASALFRGITALLDRYSGWGWDLGYALLTLALGAFVVASWPVSSFWVLGAIVGAEIIMRGITLVAASLTIREIEHGHPVAA